MTTQDEEARARELLAQIAGLKRRENLGERTVDTLARGYNAAIDDALAVIRAALKPDPVAREVAFQARVQPWMMECFGAEIAADQVERCDRFIEEALELVQSMGHGRERTLALVDYVYGRPAGEPSQEVGGVMVTLAALCLAAGLDMHEAGETELARINVPETVAKIRAKQAAKPTGSALPVAHHAPARDGALREAAAVARAHSDDRPGRDRHFDWNDGYQDGCRGASDAILALVGSDAVAGVELLDAMAGCTGVASGPDGHGTMRVVAQGFPPGAEMALSHLLSQALATNPSLSGEGGGE